MENETDKLLAELNGEETPKDESLFEEPEIKDEQQEEKKEILPFHKDPKVQKFIDKQVAKALENHKPTATENFAKEVATEDDPLLDVLTRVIGNDTPEKVSAIKDFKKALDSRDAKVRQEAVGELQALSQKEREKQMQAQSELQKGFENIEDTFSVDITSKTPQAIKMRNDFVDFIKRIAPKDAQGEVADYPDLEETFKLFQDVSKSAKQPSRAKELASRGMMRSGEAPANTQPRDYSWRGVEKMIAKLDK